MILVLTDVVLLYLALYGTVVIRYGINGLDDHIGAHLFPFSVIFILWLFSFYLFDLYTHRILRNYKIILSKATAAVFTAGVASVMAFYLFEAFFALTPKTNLLVFSIILFILLSLSRLITLRIISSGAVNVALVGSSPIIKETEKYLEQNPQAGYKISMRLDNLSRENSERLAEAVKKRRTDLIVIRNNLTKNFEALRMIYSLLPFEMRVVYFWNFYEEIFEKAPLEELGESWFIENISTRRPFYDALKRGVDLLLAFLLFIILLPVSVLIGLVIKVTSPGPAIFKQKRIGKNNRHFTLYKFRTMKDGIRGPLWTDEKDKRVTGFGKILRFSHLDEIPQLINIIKGDISFTGPRPERIELAEKYAEFPYYEMRHVVKPGLSGWAQINFQPSASLEEAYEKLRYDIYYVKNRSFLLDLIIIFKTIKRFFSYK